MNGHGNGGIALVGRRMKVRKGSIGARIASVVLGVSLVVGTLGVPSAQAHGTMNARDPYFHAVWSPTCINGNMGVGSTVAAMALVSSTGYWRATLYRYNNSGGIVRWSPTTQWMTSGPEWYFTAGTRGSYAVYYEFWWPVYGSTGGTHGMWGQYACSII